MKGIIMMKRQRSMLLVGLMFASLGCSTTAQAGSNDGFVVGMCAVGAAVLGVAGAVALVDWCCSETDEQLIARVDAECGEVYSRYFNDMIYFGRVKGVILYIPSTFAITESVLHEFATHVWNSNMTLRDYCSAVMSAKNSLQSSVQTLRKRVIKFEAQCCKARNQYDLQNRLHKMRQLLQKSEELLASMTCFADVLEAHNTYFDLYDVIDVVRSKYFQEITILESERYATEMEIKRSIVNRDNGQYAFRNFVIAISSDINNLDSKIRSLKHRYDAKRQYAQMLVNYLTTIKSIVVNDPRYQQELFAWEQAELQRRRLETERVRAQAEQDRAWAERQKAQALREQNRILQERNRLERERIWNERQCNNDSIDINVNVELVI
jgi:hypothetical protein